MPTLLATNNPTIKAALSGLANPNAIRTCFKRSNTKNGVVRDHLYNLVIEVSPTVYRAIKDLGRVGLGANMVHTEDYSRFKQCLKCLQFGHTKAKCTASGLACSHCASKEHDIATCPTKKDKSPKCFNCHGSNVSKNKSFSDSHSATSSECPVVQKYQTTANEHTNYGC